MQIKLLRHATLVIQLGGIRLLIDPMLSPKGAMAAVDKSPKMRPNPLVELPIDNIGLDQLLESLDAILVTHTHRDHFDTAAATLLPKDKPVFCQPEDENSLKALGFQEVFSVSDQIRWKDLTFTRTGGHHGSPLMSPKLGPVSGFVLETAGEPKLYITGDTIWCKEVRQALEIHQPDVVVAYAGAAQFLLGGRITMSICDMDRITRQLTAAKVVAVHMEAFNHCMLTRKNLRAFIDKKELSGRVLVPEDGETISI